MVLILDTKDEWLLPSQCDGGNFNYLHHNVMGVTIFSKMVTFNTHTFTFSSAYPTRTLTPRKSLNKNKIPNVN